VGIWALTFLIKIIKMLKILSFSYYCCGMGIWMIILMIEETNLKGGMKNEN